MAQDKKGIMKALGKIDDFLSDKLTSVVGEKWAERTKAAARLVATVMIASPIISTIGFIGVGLGVGATAVIRAAYKKPAFKPFTDLIKSTVNDLGILWTGAKEVGSAVDKTLDDSKSAAPEASEGALKKDIKGPFNGGPSSKPSNDLGHAPGVGYKGPRMDNVA